MHVEYMPIVEYSFFTVKAFMDYCTTGYTKFQKKIEFI